MQIFDLFPKASHYPKVFRLWFSPSGRRLVALGGHSGGANHLWNWDVAERRVLGRRRVVNDPEHDNGFPFPCFDRSMRYLLFDSHVEDRRTRRRIKLDYTFYDAALSPDGRTAFALADDYEIHRFDLAWDFKGKETRIRHDKARVLKHPVAAYRDQLLVGPNGDLLVAITSDGTRLLPFRLSDDAPLPAVELPASKTDGVRMSMEPYGRLRFAPDGRTVAVAGDGVFLADVTAEGTARRLDERYFADIAFTPDGGRLVGVRPDEGLVTTWDLATGGATSFTVDTNETGRLWSVAASPRGRTAVVGGGRGKLVWWRL